jgi:hypothetical protein
VRDELLKPGCRFGVNSGVSSNFFGSPAVPQKVDATDAIFGDRLASAKRQNLSLADILHVIFAPAN